MKIRLQMIIETDDGGAETIEEIGRLERGPLRPEDLGLRIAEGLLHGMQKSLVTAQITDYLAGFKTCPHCAAPRTSKGQHSVAYRTVFGKAARDCMRPVGNICVKSAHSRRRSRKDTLSDVSRCQHRYLQK